VITLVLQSVCTLLLAAFTALALLNARRLRSGHGDSYVAWLVTGVVFSVYVADKAVQEVFGVWAFFAGPTAPIFPVYLKLATIADHSRTLLVFVLYASMVALPFRHRLGRRRSRWMFVSAIAASLLAGALLGWTEGSFLASRHLTRTAEIDTFGFVVLSATLLFLMFKSDVDRYLWFSLATYGFTSVLGVLFLSTLAWIGIATWTPAPWSMQLMRCVFAAVMILAAWWRYRAARQGRTVHPMLEPIRTPVRSL
jgi:hypothetical protein